MTMLCGCGAVITTVDKGRDRWAYVSEADFEIAYNHWQNLNRWALENATAHDVTLDCRLISIGTCREPDCTCGRIAAMAKMGHMAAPCRIHNPRDYEVEA